MRSDEVHYRGTLSASYPSAPRSPDVDPDPQRGAQAWLINLWGKLTCSIIAFCVSEGRSRKVSDRGVCSALPTSGAAMGSAELMAAEAVGGGEMISILLGSCHCDEGPLLETMAMGFALFLRACFDDGDGIVWMFEVEVRLVEGPAGRSGSYDPPITTADFGRRSSY